MVELNRFAVVDAFEAAIGLPLPSELPVSSSLLDIHFVRIYRL
jgi:hypothetical protein